MSTEQRQPGRAMTMQEIRAALGHKTAARTGDAAQATTAAPVLSNTERSFLAYALDLAADAMAATPCDYSPDDEAALTALRKLACNDIAPAADPWPTIARLTAWLDAHSGRSDAETALRLLKVTEEAGEAAQAWIGVTGQNPRKGITHATTDVADELCDVIVAAMVALTTLKKDPAGHFARKVAQIAALRLDAAGGEA